MNPRVFVFGGVRTDFLNILQAVCVVGHRVLNDGSNFFLRTIVPRCIEILCLAL